MPSTATATPLKMAAPQPWRDRGMSERTFYRHKAEGKAIPEPQHMAHVADYVRSLPSIARLEFRAYVRRCHIAAARA